MNPGQAQADSALQSLRRLMRAIEQDMLGIVRFLWSACICPFAFQSWLQ